jgi:hypothetical protein
MKLLAICALLLLPAEIRAQCATPPDSPIDAPRDTLSNPDVRIVARVRASELRFNAQPSAAATAAGCVATDTVRVLVRTNMPEPVSPGVTYQDVEVAIEIVTRLSVVCSPALLDLIGRTDAAPRLASLCVNSQTGGNRRP